MLNFAAKTSENPQGCFSTHSQPQTGLCLMLSDRKSLQNNKIHPERDPSLWGNAENQSYRQSLHHLAKQDRQVCITGGTAVPMPHTWTMFKFFWGGVWGWRGGGGEDERGGKSRVRGRATDRDRAKWKERNARGKRLWFEVCHYLSSLCYNWDVLW